MALIRAARSSITAAAILVLLISLALSHFLATGQLVHLHLSSGSVVTGRLRSGIESFGGIPYAHQPTGDFRLRPPQRLPDNHDSNIDATRTAPKCP